MKIYAVVENFENWDNLEYFLHKEKAEKYIEELRIYKENELASYKRCTSCLDNYPNFNKSLPCFKSEDDGSEYGSCSNAIDNPWITDKCNAWIKEINVNE